MQTTIFFAWAFYWISKDQAPTSMGGGMFDFASGTAKLIGIRCRGDQPEGRGTLIKIRPRLEFKHTSNRFVSPFRRAMYTPNVHSTSDSGHHLSLFTCAIPQVQAPRFELVLEPPLNTEEDRLVEHKESRARFGCQDRRKLGKRADRQHLFDGFGRPTTGLGSIFLQDKPTS